MQNFVYRKKIVGTMAILALFLLSNSAFAQALPDFTQASVSPIGAETPSLFVSNLTLNTLNPATPGTPFSGSFTVANNSSLTLSDLSYALYLSKQGETAWSKEDMAAVSFIPQQLRAHRFVDYKINKEVFRLQGGKSITKTFSYSLPADLRDGTYLFWVSAQSPRGQVFYSEEQGFDIANGSPSSLSISNIALAKTGSEDFFSPDKIAIVDSGSNLEVRFELTNSFPANLEIKPKVVVRKFNPAGPVALSTEGEIIKTSGAGTISKTISIPHLDPGKYFAYLDLGVHPILQNNPTDRFFRVASNARLDLIVPGEYAEIQTIGETITGISREITTIVEGPSLPSNQNLRNLEVKFAVTDLNNNRVTHTNQKVINLTDTYGTQPANSAVFELAGAQPMYSKYTITISKNGKVLDEYSVRPNGDPPSGGALPKPSPASAYIIILFILIAGIVVGSWIYFRRMKTPMGSFMLVALVISLGLFLLPAPTKAATWDWFAGGWTASWLDPKSPNPTTPLALNPGQELTVFLSGQTTNWGFRCGKAAQDVCKNQNLSSDDNGIAYVFLTNTTSFTPNTTMLTPSKYADYFNTTKPAEPNYAQYLGRIIGPHHSDKLACDGNACTTEQSQSYRTGGASIIPMPDNVPEGDYYIYVNGGFFIGHEKIRLTNLTYQLNVEPSLVTMGLGDTATFDVSVVPQRMQGVAKKQPAEFFNVNSWSPNITMSPNKAGIVNYWNSPEYDSQYGPGDKITFALGSGVLGQGANGNCRGSAAGSSFAAAFISKAPPKNPKTLAPDNTADQFAGTDWRPLGLLNSGLQAGYNNDCSVWFAANVEGDKTVPQNSLLCNASGGLVSFFDPTKPTKAYVTVIYQAGLGSFVAYQEIILTTKPDKNPPPPESIFAEPITLSLPTLNSLGQILSCLTSACDDSKLGDPLTSDTSNVEFVAFGKSATGKSVPVLAIHSEDATKSYPPSELKVKIGSFNEAIKGCGTYVAVAGMFGTCWSLDADGSPIQNVGPPKDYYKCPAGYVFEPYSTAFGNGDCFSPIFGVVAPSAEKQTSTISPIPAGKTSQKFKFKVNAFSGGDLPGLSKTTPDPIIEVTNAFVPPPFDNLRMNGAGSCNNVPLTWDPADFSMPNPIAWWKMDEQPGNNTVADSAGTHNGTANAGAPVLVPGKIGNARNFNNGKVDVSGIGSGPQGTMEAWIKPSGNYGGQQHVMGGYASPGAQFPYNLFANAPSCGGWGAMAVFDAENSSYQYVCSGESYNTTNFPSTEWTHIAVTFNGTTMNFYRNGNLVSAKNLGKTFGQTSAVPFSIGSFGANGQYFMGGIDDVRLYDRALSEAEIKEQLGGPSINEYRVYRLRPTGNGQWIDISGRIADTVVTFTDNEISNPLNPPQPNGTYSYKVAATNAAGTQESNVFSATTPSICTAEPSLQCSGGQDIGLKVREGGQNVKIAVEPAGALTSPLRIRKGGVTYGIVLVDPTDPNASKMRVKTSLGIKALCKLPP